MGDRMTESVTDRTASGTASGVTGAGNGDVNGSGSDGGAEEHQVLLRWLTGEVALYVLILGLSLAVRLGALGLRIMDTPEAGQAWQAWQLAHGTAPVGRYSPLLLFGQAFLFAVFGASDAAARFWPALLGSVVVVLPFFARPRLGRTGSLAAALALALSPTLVYSSRYGDGLVLLLLAALAPLVLWWAYRRERRVEFLYAIVLVDALALLADPRVIGVLIVQGLSWAVERYVFGRDAIALDAGTQAIPWKKLGLAFGVTLVLGATAFALNPGGLGAWADFPSAWVEHLAPVVNGQPWYYPLFALVLYEPLLLFFGVIGAVDLLVRRDEAAILVWMALGLLIVALLAGGRNAGDVALVCAPLALLAGRGIGNLAESWRREGILAREGIFALVVLGILVFATLEATYYAYFLYRNIPEAWVFFWRWLVAVAVLTVLVGLCFAWFGTGVTWRTGGGVIAVVLLLNAFSATIGLNFRHANDPRELHVQSSFVEGTRDALKVMADVSYHQRGSPIATPVTVEARLGPVWRWYLRDWEDVTFVDQLTPDVTTPMIVTSGDESLPAVGGGLSSSDRYMGQDFVVRKWWAPGQLVSNDQLTWWFYRQSLIKPIPVESVIVWVRVQEAVASNP